nr:MAG TPA: hypothetical protein [Caudoviricetes sp.]
MGQKIWFQFFFYELFYYICITTMNNLYGGTGRRPKRLSASRPFVFFEKPNRRIPYRRIPYRRIPYRRIP